VEASQHDATFPPNHETLPKSGKIVTDRTSHHRRSRSGVSLKSQTTPLSNESGCHPPGSGAMPLRPVTTKLLTSGDPSRKAQTSGSGLAAPGRRRKGHQRPRQFHQRRERDGGVGCDLAIAE